MAGLLGDFGDFLKTPEGQGLLSGVMGYAANARRGTPWNNFGRGGMAGIAGYAGALDRQQQASEAAQMNKYRDMQQQTMQMQIDAARKAEADKATERALAGKYFTPGSTQTVDAPVNGSADAGPNLFSTSPSNMTAPKQVATPSKFDYQGYAKELASIDPLRAYEVEQRFAKAPIKLGAGDVLLDPTTNKVLYSNPKDDKPDSKIAQYEFAKANGYKGTFEQFVTLGPTIMAAAAAPLRNAQIGNIEAENNYNLPPPRKPVTKPSTPMPGQVVQGYRFKGGNPADQNNWEKQ